MEDKRTIAQRFRVCKDTRVPGDNDLSEGLKLAIELDDVDLFKAELCLSVTFKYCDDLVEETGKCGAMKILKYIVDNDLWTKHANNEIALVRALENDHFDMVSYLMDVNVNLNCRDGECLREMVQKYGVHIVTIILEKCYNKYDLKETILLCACTVGSSLVVQYLIDQGADITFQRRGAYTAAISSNNVATLKLICDKLWNEVSPLDGMKEAIKTQSTQAFVYLATKYEGQQHNFGWLLTEAIRYKAYSIVVYLVETCGAQVSGAGCAVVSTAIERKDDDIFDFIFGHASGLTKDVVMRLYNEAINIDNFHAIKTIFHRVGPTMVPAKELVEMVAKRGHNHICHWFMTFWNPNDPSEYDPCLIEACELGLLDTVKLFVVNGSSVDANGGAPIIRAARAGRLRVVKYLLENYADVSVLTPEVVNGIDPRHAEVITYLKDLLCMNDREIVMNDDNDDDGEDDDAANFVPLPIANPTPDRRNPPRRINTGDMVIHYPMPPNQPPRPIRWSDPPSRRPVPPNPPSNQPPPPKRPRRPQEKVSANISYLRSQILDRLSDVDECPVCLEKLKSMDRDTIVFWPKCEHMICAQCEYAIDKCPICRSRR